MAKAVLTAQVLPLEEAFGASEQVGATGHAEIPHAAGQCGRRNTGVIVVRQCSLCFNVFLVFLIVWYRQ